MGYMELSVTYMLDEREQKALEELLPSWQQYEDKAGEKPFANMTLPQLFDTIMRNGCKYDVSKHIKNEQFRQGIIDSSELIGNGEFLLSEERKVVHDRLRQMTLKEKVDFLEKYEAVKSKDPLEKTISPVDARLKEILLMEQCGKIWSDIHKNRLKPSHILVNAIGHLHELTGKNNTLMDVKWLAKATDVVPEVREAVDEIVDEWQRQEEEAFRQEMQDKMMEKSKHMSVQEKEAFIEGIEYAKDTSAVIKSWDIMLYEILIEERREEERKVIPKHKKAKNSKTKVR